MPPALRLPDLSESAFKRALKTHLLSTARRHWHIFMILALDINEISRLTYLLVKTDIQKYTDNKETAEISLCHYISVLCECVHAHRHSEFPAVLSVKRIWKSRPFRFGTEHTGNKVDRIGNKVNRNKMLNSRCCRLVAKTSNTVERIWYTATVDFVADFGNSWLSTKSTVLNPTLSPLRTGL